MSEIGDLIKQIHQWNKRNDYESIMHKQTSPRLDAIYALDGETTRPLSKYLRDLYSEIDYWEDALLGEDILSLEMIRDAWKIEWVKEHIELRMENFSTPPGGGFNLSDISILCCDKNNNDEMYLIWSRTEEPRVIKYFGGDVKVFEDVLSLLTFCANMPDV